MSNWTHVAGIIRLDDSRDDEESDNEIKKRLEDYFGKELLNNSPKKDWEEAYNHPERYLPLGSEGSLKMSVWINPKIGSIAAYTVSIFGDLRDHESADEIIDWFKEKCCNDDIWVRNAIVTAHNEFNGNAMWEYSDDD